jgi:hypothetical protein
MGTILPAKLQNPETFLQDIHRASIYKWKRKGGAKLGVKLHAPLV